MLFLEGPARCHATDLQSSCQVAELILARFPYKSRTLSLSCLACTDALPENRHAVGLTMQKVGAKAVFLHSPLSALWINQFTCLCRRRGLGQGQEAAQASQSLSACHVNLGPRALCNFCSSPGSINTVFYRLSVGAGHLLGMPLSSFQIYHVVALDTSLHLRSMP